MEAPRRVDRSRRGLGVAEFRIRLTPPPTREVRDAYNASRPSDVAHAKLRPEGFVVLCAEGDISRRLELIREHSLARLAEITVDLRDQR
jgi:hypothetical protein